MRSHKTHPKTLSSGFTIIEVSLFLALTGLVLLGIMAGVSSSISSKRFSDSAQETAEFIRSTYSMTINPMNNSTTATDLSCSRSRTPTTTTTTTKPVTNQGQSTCALYGTLIVFGEDDSTTIKTYQVVGNADVPSSATTLNEIGNLQRISTAFDEYTPVWGATIEKTEKSTDLYEGQVLIIRMPSGVIQTRFAAGDSTSIAINDTNFPSPSNDLDLCLNSPDAPSGQRYDIRIAKNGTNSSAVQIVSLTSEDSKCLL